MLRFSVLVLTLIFSLLPNFAVAWGERGHDLITRVAIQHLRYLSDDQQSLVRPFTLRDHMLAHLSNVPDIVWRAPYQSETVKELNPPTHYINLEKVISGVQRWDDLSRDFQGFRALCAEHGKTPEEVGTAPWRSFQLYGELVNALKAIHHASDEADFERRVNDALLIAGNPHHTTANYDGQLSSQSGLHAYFESTVVADLNLKLASKIERQARKPWLGVYRQAERQQILSNPQKLIWALVANSHSHLDTLLKLDQRHSLLEPSTAETPAVRKDVAKVSQRFERFTVQRLAIGADVLARLYQLAWQQAGQPDLSNFSSYYYPVKPEFIAPDYQ